MNRTLKLAIFVSTAVLGGWFVWRMLEGDTARIRRLVLEVETAFNAGSMGGMSAALAPNFRQKPDGLERNEVVAMLAHLFLTERDQKTKAFLHQVTVGRDAIDISFEEGSPPRAKLSLEVDFGRRAPSGEFNHTARVRFDGRVEKLDGAWKLIEAEAKRIDGKWPPF